MKRLRSFETSGPTHPSTQRRVKDDATPHQRTCENIKSRIHRSICMYFVSKLLSFQTKATGANARRCQIFRYRKIRYNWTVTVCSCKSTSKLSPQSKLIHEASYLSLPCLVRMLSLCNRFNTFHKYSFNLSSYVTENTTPLHYKHPLLNVLLNTVAMYCEPSQ